MGTIAAHRMGERSRRDFDALVDAAVLAFDARFFAAGGASANDVLTARAVASVGIVALVGLPFLMLSSMLLDAPLAVPAAIASGYLLLSQALLSRHRRRAALIDAALLCGLVGWLIAFLVGRGGELSQAALTAALLAPVFAAAPAFARSIIAQRRTDSAHIRRNAASEGPVQVLNVAEPARGVEPWRGDGEVAVAKARPAIAPLQPVADLGAAIDFALRRAKAKVALRKIALIEAGEPDISVACDRQALRRIVCRLIDAALAECEASSVRIVSRKLKGAALLRVSAESETSDGIGAADESTPETMAPRELIEAAGGTLVVDRDVCGVTWSVRLDLAREARARYVRRDG